MLPGPTNVPERVTRAMVTPSINHRSDDFVELYEECVDNTKKIFETEGDAVCLSASGTGATECSVVNLIKKDDKVIIPVNGEFSSRLAEETEKSTTQLSQNAIFGAILVILTLYFGIGFRNALIVTFAIPFSLLTAYLLQLAFGISQSGITMFSLIMVLGIVVDGAIIVSEATFREMENGKGS